LILNWVILVGTEMELIVAFNVDLRSMTYYAVTSP
jgi:hypothetical protein